MGKYIDGSGLSHLMSVIKGAFLTSVDWDSTNKKLTKTKGGTTSDVWTPATVASSGSYADLSNKPSIPSATSTTPKMDGTAAVGGETTWAKGDHVHPTDTTRVPTSRTINGLALSSDVWLDAADIDTNSGISVEAAFQNIVVDGVWMGQQTADYMYRATHYTTCSTAAGTAAKAVSLTETYNNFILTTGAVVYVKFTTTNTAAVGSLTLNVDSKGAKPIKYRGGNLPSAGTLAAGRVYQFVYDGTNWELMGDLDTNTTYSDATTSTHGLMTAADKTKLNGIATGAEVNQNAFSTVRVLVDDGVYEVVSADSKTDTLYFEPSGAISLTADGDDTITISSIDTKNTAGSTDTSSKIYLVGATSQAMSQQTYSQDTAYVGTDGHLYSNSKQAVNLSDTQALTNKTYNGLTLTKAATGFTIAGGTTSKTLTVNNTYTLGAACAKGVDTSISAGSTSTNLPTTAAVVSYIGEVAGAMVYKGAVNAESSLLSTALKVGWYYIVGTAGSYAGQACEAGDMIIVHTAGTYTSSSALAAAVDIIQTNIEALSNSEIDTLWAAA